MDEQQKKAKQAAYHKKWYEANKKKLLAKRKTSASYAEYQKQYAQANREKINARVKKYREDNKDKVLECKKEWRKANKEKIAVYNKEYRQENKEQIALRLQKWNNENRDAVLKYREENKEKNRDRLREYKRAFPEKYAHHCAKRRAAKNCATPKWANLSAIQEFYIKASELEKIKNEKYHVDHIVPLKGKNVCGLHVEHNLRVIPAIDNLRKSNRHKEITIQ
jgi:hypothetical protein